MMDVGLRNVAKLGFSVITGAAFSALYSRGIIRWKEALNHERSTAWLKLAASHHSRL